MTVDPNEKIVQLNLKIRFYLDEITPADLNVFLYQLVNTLNYEHDVLEVSIDGKTATDLNDEQVKILPLREGKDLE